MKKVKNILLGVVALLIVIIVLQNTDSVRTRLLFMTIEMPRAILLLVTLLIGFVIGLAVGVGGTRKLSSPKE